MDAGTIKDWYFWNCFIIASRLYYNLKFGACETLETLK